MTKKARLLRDASDRRGDSGASLILALVFLVAFALIIGALANWTSTGLGAALQIQNAASKYYAAEGVTQIAIRQLRYAVPTTTTGTSFACPLNVPADSATPTSSAALTVNSVQIQDWCQIQETGNTFRVATVTACLMTSGGQLTSPGPCTPTSGSATELLQAQVTFTDYSSTPNPASPTCSANTLANCGVSMSFDYWNAA